MDIERNPHFLKSFLTEEIYLVREAATAAASQPEAAPEVPQHVPALPTPAPATAQEQLLIILKNSFATLDPSQQQLLQKILSAVKIDIATAKLLSEADYRSMPEVVNDYQTILTFGVDLPQAPIRYQAVQKGVQQFLSSDSLAALEQAIALKGKLWKAMQQLFGL